MAFAPPASLSWGELALALGFRLLLAAAAGTTLRSRMEVASLATGLDAHADASLLFSHGAPSLGGFRGSPLMLPLVMAATDHAFVTLATLGAVCDAGTTAMVQRLARSLGAPAGRGVAAAQAFLWSPLAVVACAGASLGPVYVAAVVAAAALAAEGRAGAAGTALAWAAQLAGPQAGLFLPPLLLLSWQYATSALTQQASGGESRGAKIKRCVLLAATFVIVSALLTAAGAVLLNTRMSTLNCTAGADSAACSLSSSKGSWVHRIISSRDSLFSSSLLSSSRDVLPWSHLRPNIGLQWYLFAQVFPRFRNFFGFCFAALPAAVAVPLALRFPHRPMLALCVQALVLCMLRAHPTYTDITLWMALLPLLHEELSHVRHMPWLALGLVTALACNTAAHELWLSLGQGNANFLYGMNLAWAGCLVAAMVQLLRAGCRAEVEAAVGAGGVLHATPDAFLPSPEPYVDGEGQGLVATPGEVVVPCAEGGSAVRLTRRAALQAAAKVE